jgi:hypothetical protein
VHVAAAASAFAKFLANHFEKASDALVAIFGCKVAHALTISSFIAVAWHSYAPTYLSASDAAAPVEATNKITSIAVRLTIPLQENYFMFVRIWPLSANLLTTSDASLGAIA